MNLLHKLPKSPVFLQGTVRYEMNFEFQTFPINMASYKSLKIEKGKRKNAVNKKIVDRGRIGQEGGHCSNITQWPQRQIFGDKSQDIISKLTSSGR